MTGDHRSAPDHPAPAVPHEGRHFVGALQVGGMSGTGDHFVTGAGSDGPGHPSARGR